MIGDDVLGGPTTGQILLERVSSFSKNFKIGHLNAQSLRGHIDEFRELCSTNIFDVILVSHGLNLIFLI
jgi:hypothetical protein